jgi:hypothetical protein
MFVLLGGAARAAEDAVEARMRRDVTFLASDECEGRGVSTKGINLAADFIAREFQAAGLQPGVDGKSYFQPFTMNGGATVGEPNTLVLHGPLGQTITLKQGTQFKPFGMASSGQVSAPVVFVGFGATAKDIGYDDYHGVDVAGKIVVILRKVPRADDAAAPFDGKSSAYHSTFTTKNANAEAHRAAAVIYVNDQDSVKAMNGDQLLVFNYTALGGSPAKLPIVQVRRSIVDDMLQSSLGTTLGQLEEDMGRDLKPRSAALAGWRAEMQVTVHRTTLAVKNVVGVLEGSGPKANETVVVGAHYDHLGYGGAGSLAGRNVRAIHHGADDNGSGTTTLLELARHFGHIKNREGRRLVFIAFSGEESGLLGSDHYCKHPLFPLADTVTMVNLDMVGRLRPGKDSNKDKLIVYGTGTATTFDELIELLNKDFGFQLQKIPSGFGPSDHASFYAKNVPVFFFFTGDHPDYHRPSDTADKINVHGMRRVGDLVENLVSQLASVPERPKYVKVAGSSGGTPGFSGPRLGIRPSYDDDKEGVLLEGVAEGGAAERAGLKAGDRITEMAGKPVKNLEAYMALLQGRKKGDPLEISVLRDGKKVTLTVTPQ